MRSRPRVRKARATLASWVRPVLLSLAAATVVVSAAWAGWSRAVPYVVGHDYFRLRSIRVSSDETRVAPQALAEIAGLYEDESLWRVDPDAIRETLRSASWVRQASVTRSFPWQVNLSVERRYGVAAAVADGRAYLVDAEGVLFHEVEKTAVPDLPYLTGWDEPEAQAERAARLRALLGVLKEAGGRSLDVSELHMDADGAVWLYATDVKAAVRLGDSTRAATGLDRLAIALKELGPLSDRARVIDTDYPGRIVIRGVDDKLPAMLAAQADRGMAAAQADRGMAAAQADRGTAARAGGETSDALDIQTSDTRKDQRRG